jgi:arginase family enzyme
VNVQIFVVPYVSGRLRWRCGAGPEHLLNAGLTTHLHNQGHVVTGVQVLEDDPAYPSVEIRTTFELARRLAVAARAAHDAGHFAEATFLLGARDLDPPEVTLLRQSAVTVVEVGQIPGQLPDLLARAQLADTIGYLHLDLDVLDPTVGRANYLPVPDGLSLPQLTGAITAIRAHVPLRAAALTSYSPEEDRDGGIARAAVAAVDAILGNG